MLDGISNIIPTDNLYRFMALFGLVLSAFCFFYPEWRLYNIEKNSIMLEGKSKLISLEIDNNMAILNADMRMRENMLKEQIHHKKYPKAVYSFDAMSDDELSDYFSSKNKRDSYDFIYRNGTRLSRIERKRITHEEMLYGNLKNEYKSQVKKVELENNKNAIKFEEKRVQRIEMLAFYGRIFSILLSIAGFSLWYINIQRIQDKILLRQLQQ